MTIRFATGLEDAYSANQLDFSDLLRAMLPNFDLADQDDVQKLLAVLANVVRLAGQEKLAAFLERSEVAAWVINTCQLKNAWQAEFQQRVQALAGPWQDVLTALIPILLEVWRRYRQQS